MCGTRSPSLRRADSPAGLTKGSRSDLAALLIQLAGLLGAAAPAQDTAGPGSHAS